MHIDSTSLLRSENATYKQDQSLYMAEYEQIKGRGDKCKNELEAAKARIVEQTAKKEKLRRFIRGLELNNEGEAQYSDELFMLMIDHIDVKVIKDDMPVLVFVFTDGTEIKIKVERKK